ncbi:unnamed protein product, partial [marine sediment metagenome]
MAWKGYTPGSAEALMAAATYQPGIMIQEPGYPEPEAVSGLVPTPAEMVGMAMAVIAGQEEPTAVPTAYPTPTAAPVVTNGVVTTLPPVLNGEVGIMGAEEEVYGPVAVPTAFPVIAGIATMSLGIFKGLLARYGPTIVKMLIGATAFTAFMKLLGIGASDATEVPIKPGEKKRKRYSIGANPRVGTLRKVSRHCMRMLKRHR